MVDLDHPLNRGVLAHLSGPARLRSSVSIVASTPECSPADVADPYYTLGTHPDLVARLWDELGSTLPVDCRSIVFGTPVLVRPDSGILFGFAGGTHTYAFRVPPDVKSDALSAGAEVVYRYPAYPELNIEASVLDLQDMGPEWVFGGWHRAEDNWCHAAYAFAAESAIDVRHRL